ncbi:winged-helix domain-containing protein [Streptomyces sp. NPDC059904]|uniref:winged-helix domain-containing protein n=1 Tax=Streptomyces sp. NPDC059904 TaxID=3346996 RepID=UPI00365D5C35
MRQVARDAEPDLHGLITARRVELELQAEKLSQQLQDVRDELEELTVAERVARRLAERLRAETRTTPGGAGQVAGRTVLLVPQREPDTDETVLPEDCQRIMDVVRRADTPVMVKQVCGELRMSKEPARSEAMRSKLNRLAERGWLRKLADGKFTTTL